MKEWDLIPVSREEFKRRQEDEGCVIAELEEVDEDDVICMTHYTTREGDYLGTIKLTDEGAEYLVPELVDGSEED